MITSRQNRRLKDIRRLRRSKGDRALLEGPHLVAEALASDLVLEEVLTAPGFFEREGAGRELRDILAALPEPPVEVAPELLAELADADSPKGLLAVARLPRGGVESLPRPNARAGGETYLYLDGLQDPGNLGAVARSAEAAGAAGLALSPGCVHPNHPRALRGSAGSLLRLPAAVGVEPDGLDDHLAGRARWLALVPRGGEVLWRAELSAPLVLAVGAEGPGLSDALLHRCHLRATIPLAPGVESLNAAVAAALVLFEVRRREFA
ncbi:MAG: TrmH family RNA methyltransferase [Thermoanaerobaculia bacterium]